MKLKCDKNKKCRFISLVLRFSHLQNRTETLIHEWRKVPLFPQLNGFVRLFLKIKLMSTISSFSSFSFVSVPLFSCSPKLPKRSKSLPYSIYYLQSVLSLRRQKLFRRTTNLHLCFLNTIQSSRRRLKNQKQLQNSPVLYLLSSRTLTSPSKSAI